MADTDPQPPFMHEDAAKMVSPEEMSAEEFESGEDVELSSDESSSNRESTSEHAEQQEVPSPPKLRGRREESVDEQSAVRSNVGAASIKRRTHKPRSKDAPLVTPPEQISADFQSSFRTFAVNVVWVLVALIIFLYLRNERAPMETTSPFLEDHIVIYDGLLEFGHERRRAEAFGRRLEEQVGIDAAVIFKQYKRMRHACWNISYQLGFASDLPDIFSAEQHYCYKSLFGRIGAPFFCLNALLDQFAAGEILTIQEQQRHLAESVERLRETIPVDSFDLARQIIDSISARNAMRDNGAPDALKPFEDITQATNVQMGYLEHGVLVRNLYNLENDEAALWLIPYDKLTAMARRLHEHPASYDDAVCSCGLYSGMARAMVLSRHRNKTLLLLEPQVLRAYGQERLLASTDLPWQQHTPLAYMSQKAWSSAALSVIGDSPDLRHLYFDHLDVLSVALKLGADDVVHVESVRKMHNLSGSPAICVQHCALIALRWKEEADNEPPPLEERFVL